MTDTLRGQVAVVTGASRGIGRAIALELASCGAHVAINYAGRAQAAADVVRDVRAHGVESFSVAADVSQADQMQAVIDQTIAKWGKVDVLVTNAGITRDNLLMRMTDEQWDEVLNTNLKGVFHGMRAVARPMMKQRYGRIVAVSSVVASLGNAGQANYVAAKAGVIGLTKTMARELAARNITVNAVAPGFIHTEMTAQLPEDIRNTMLRNIPLGTFGEPEHVARVVRFLVSPDAGYMTGQTLFVDGGMTMH